MVEAFTPEQSMAWCAVDMPRLGHSSDNSWIICSEEALTAFSVFLSNVTQESSRTVA